MSGFGPTGGGQNPFEGIFGDLARMLGSTSSGPLNWDIAKQIAVMTAGEGRTEANVDPVERMKVQELARVAELHVGQASALDPRVGAVTVTNHVDWANRTLEDWKQLLERMAVALSKKPQDDGSLEDADPVATHPGADFLAQFAQMEKFVAPMLLGMQAGGMVGHLARRSLGQYDLPLPRRRNDELVVVPANVRAFADEWSLPFDELLLFVCVEEITRSTILGLPHVKARLEELLLQYVDGFQPNPEALNDQLSGFDMSDPSQIPAMLSDPEMLLGAMQSDAQRQTLVYISALVAALVGYVDHVVGQVGQKAIPSAPVIFEAIKRRRVEDSDGHRLVEKLLGLELAQSQIDRGTAFIDGVVQRAGDEGLARLWRDADDLPTPAEVDAPWLWLARLGISVDDSDLDRAVEALFEDPDLLNGPIAEPPRHPDDPDANGAGRNSDS